MKDVRTLIYLGGENYKVKIGNIEIQLTEQEIDTFIKSIAHMISDELIQDIIQDREYDVSDLFNDDDDDDDDDYYKKTRVYNKREKIIELFNSHYDNKKTKKEVFIQIAKELNITFKAVEKAFYTKQ